MEVSRRSANPLIVHQLWDAISQAGPNQIMDSDKLMTTVMSAHQIPKDELKHELEYAVEDDLIVTEEVEAQKREESQIYKLPDVSEWDVEMEDHDWYCFQCHLGGTVPVVRCNECPRVYHLDCLPEDCYCCPERALFVCPACQIMATKPSAERVAVPREVLNQLVKYICDRFTAWNIESLDKADGETWAAAGNRSSKEAWRFSLLVRMPMDLETMVGKASKGKYASLEEFQVDCETLAHAMGVYFGLGMLKKGQLGEEFLREVTHDIEEVKLCHDCFLRSNEKSHDWWFCLPCHLPHEVVWAKQSGYPFWPAKVMKKDGNKYDVRYFGGEYERGVVDAKNTRPIETSIPQLKVRQTALWNVAFDELIKFQDIAKDPDLIQKLPPKGGRGASSAPKVKGAKRGAPQSPEEVVTKKSRKCEPPSTPKFSRKSDPKPVVTPETNRTATSTPASTPGRKKAAKSVKASPPSALVARRDSASASTSKSATGPSPNSVKTATSSKENKKPVCSDLSGSHLDPDVVAFLDEVDDNESLDGDAYVSDKYFNEPQEKVSEDPVSSSSYKESKSTQVAHQGFVRDDFIKKFTELQERHKLELSRNKKKQWCSNCDQEAIWYCCLTTAYCSIECQEVHWTREHKRKCRRKKPE